MLIVSGTQFQDDSSLQVRWGSRLLLNVGMLTKTCSPETQIKRKMSLVSICFPERQNKRQFLGLQANWCPILWRLTKGDPSSLLHPSSGQHLSVSDPKTVSYLSLQYLRLPVRHVKGKRVTPNLCHRLLWSAPS